MASWAEACRFIALPPYSDSDARRRAFAFERELEYADGITRLRGDFTDF